MADSSASTNQPASKPEETSKHDKPENPDLAAIKTESAIVAEQLAIAQNRQKMLSMIFPSDLKPLEGSAKIDGDHPIESQILAYRSLNRVADTIANDVSRFAPKCVLIHADADVSGLLGLQTFRQQLELLEKEFNNERQSATTALAEADSALSSQPSAQVAALPMAILGAGIVIRSAIDLLGMFRTDIALKYKDLTIGDLALVAAVSGRLCEKNITVYDPALLQPHPFDIDSPIFKKMDGLTQLQGAMERQRDDIATRQAKLKQRIDEVTAEIQAGASATPPKDPGLLKRQLSLLQQASDRLTTNDARLSSSITSFVNLKTALLKPDDSSGLNALAKIIRAEKFVVAAGNNSHLLLLKVAAAGGGFKTKQSRFGSAEVTYSGGTIVEHLLFDHTGRIMHAATHPVYTGFVTVKEREEKATNLDNVEP